MKSITKVILFTIISSMLLCGCSSDNNTAKSNSNDIHLYDYEQTPLQLGIDTENPSDNINSDKLEYKPLNYSPQSAMWFTANDYPDILLGKTEEEFTTTIKERFSNAKSLGINTVYVHVRAFGDAYYNSELFSEGLFMSPNCEYDPLDIMISTAHEMELSIHAWINPLRCQSEIQMNEMDDSFTLKQWFSDDDKKEKYMSLVGDRWWLCPAYTEVREFIAKGAAEIVHNYDVDGINIDDYFYPTENTDFDAYAFKQSNSKNLSEFRKEQCSLMVSEIYDAIKSENPNVLFGISPQGTLNGNDKQYSDVKKWCSQDGYCDYIVPQIYFGLKNETAPFAETAALWKAMTTDGNIQLVIGICTYKMGKEDIYAGNGKNEWQNDHSISSKEVKLVRDMKLGTALYSYDSTFCPTDENADYMEKERSAIETLLLK